MARTSDTSLMKLQALQQATVIILLAKREPKNNTLNLVYSHDGVFL